MRRARALPINQLMLAAGSLMSPAAALPVLGGPPGENERPHLSFGLPTMSGTPSIIMLPDHCPWTQIRLGAGPPDASLAPMFLTGGTT